MVTASDHLDMILTLATPRGIGLGCFPDRTYLTRSIPVLNGIELSMILRGIGGVIRMFYVILAGSGRIDRQNGTPK